MGVMVIVVENGLDEPSSWLKLFIFNSPNV